MLANIVEVRRRNRTKIFLMMCHAIRPRKFWESFLKRFRAEKVVCMRILLYADDILLVAPSVTSLPKLLDYALQTCQC